MSLATAPIIRATERLYTLVKRAQVSTQRDDHRDAIVETFEAMATELGKLAVKFKPADWQRVHLSIADLHSAAVYAEETRAETFSRLGGDTAIITSLHGLAANLGFKIEDAATARPTEADDDAAMAAVEGTDNHERIAAE